jgi:hypothetical protein
MQLLACPTTADQFGRHCLELPLGEADHWPLHLHGGPLSVARDFRRGLDRAELDPSGTDQSLI